MEKLILLWLPLQGDVQRRQHFSRAILLSFVKLISTCDLKWGGGLPLAAKRSWNIAALRRHWGKLLYHCTVWLANYIGDAIRTLIAFSMNFSHTQTVIKYETDLSKSSRCTCVYLEKSLSQTGQQKVQIHSAWLAQNNWSSKKRRNVSEKKKKLLLMFCVKCLSALILSLFGNGFQSVVKKCWTNLTGTSPCSADKRKCVLWSIKKAQAVQLYIQTRKDSVAFLTV